eukprot:g23765.t1
MVTPLLLAAREGHLAVVQLLVEHRAELECQAATGATALSIASRMGHSEVVHGLLQAKAEIGQALSVAAQAGHLPIVELLCEHHCDPNVAGRHGKDLALQQRHLPIFSLLASYGAMATEDTKDMDLLQSCARGHVESISSLDLRWFWGRNISDQDGMTPLSYCAQEGLLGPAQRLLHARAYPDGLDGLSGRRHVDGATALCLAVHEGHKELVSLLLQADADENCCMGDGITPLHLACREGHEEVVQLLLEHRADVHRPMANGLTPLGACALCNQVAVAELLVEHGADSFEPSGESDALTVALERGHSEMVALLRRKDCIVFDRGEKMHVGGPEHLRSRWSPKAFGTWWRNLNTGVLKEADHEKRVSMVPAVAEKLIAKGYKIAVESGAGLKSGIPDSAYQAVGCSVVNRNQVKESELLFAINPPPAEELKSMTGKTLVAWIGRRLPEGEAFVKAGQDGALHTARRDGTGRDSVVRVG